MCSLKVTSISFLILCSAVFLFVPTALAQNSARTESIFPIFVRTAIPLNPNVNPMFADLDAFHSVFVLINTNSSDATVTFQIFDTMGHQVVPQSPVFSTVAVGANSLSGAIDYSFAQRVVVGWARITSTQPIIIQEQISHDEDHNVVIGVPFTIRKSRIVKSPANRTRRAVIEVSFIPEAASEITGVSIVFPSDSELPAKGTLILRDLAGGKLFEKETNIPANGQILGTIPDLFPEGKILTNLRGLLEINFDQEVFITAIQMRAWRTGEAMDEPNWGSVP